MKKALMIMTLTLLVSTGYSFDKKGIMLGIEGNFSLIKPNGEYWQSTDLTMLFGGTIISEIGFNDYLSVAIGLGGKFHTIKVKSSPYVDIKYKSLVITIPLSFRIRPMSLLSDSKSAFSFFIGLGIDLMIPIYSKREVNNSGTISETGGIKIGSGFLTELGFGLYMNNNTLLQLTISYNMPLSNIGSYGDHIEVNFFDFSLGLLFRL